MTIEVIPVRGLPEISEGDDVAALIQAHAELRPGDVIVVTQKAVSKAEGRVVPDLERVTTDEIRRVVARRGDLVIAETRHGFVCANAGVDRSNVPEGFVSLLPEDPDASAARLSEALGAPVIVTDTFGRAWRRGQVNVAIGVAGLPALVDLRGEEDANGRLLEATVIAVADEVAAAAGLVQGKAARVPVAIVRGLVTEAPPGTSRDLIRPPEEDLFRESPLTSISARRTIRSFTDDPVPREVLADAVAAALTAPVPHGSRHATRPWTWVVLEDGPARRRLLGAMAEAWRRDLESDGTQDSVIERRLSRSDALLGAAPALAVPALTMANADAYPDEGRREAERDMFLLATGAMVHGLLLALHAQGYGSAWVSSTLFCKEEAREALGLATAWLPMGAVACGRPAATPPHRPPIDPSSHLRFE